MFEAYLQVFANGSMTLIADISMALADMNVAIHQINTSKKDDVVTISLVISCKNLSHFESIVARLRKIDGVTNVVRGYSK